MKKIAINIHVDGVDYTSDYDTFDDESEAQLKSLIRKCAKGEAEYVEFHSYQRQYYFPKPILQKAIISLIYKNES